MSRRAIPLLPLAALAIAPLLLGIVTVPYRDVAATHLAAKLSLARQLAEGNVPFLFPEASLGQPLLGNPNYQPFLPDSLLFLVLPPWNAVSVHFALSWLAALFFARRFARTLGATRVEADLAGAAFAISGPVLSAWTFWNGTALAVAPALLAAAEKLAGRAAGSDRRRAFAAAAEVGFFAALLVYCGEPVPLLLAALFGAARLAPAAVRSIRAFAAPSAAAVGIALLLAAPQIAATLQILPASSRSLAPFSFRAATAQSVPPVRGLELLAPFPHGRPDRLPGDGGFDRHSAFDGHAPYLWSLHPGWLALGLLLLHPRAFRREPLATAAIAAGVLLSAGRFLPFAEWLSPVLSLGGRIRYPVKWWYLVALALVPLVVAALRDRRERRAAPPLARAALAVAAIGGLLASLHGGPASVAFLLPAVGLAVFFSFRPGVATWHPAAAAAAGALAQAPLLLSVLGRPIPIPPPLPGRVFERVSFEPQGTIPPGVPRTASPQAWNRLFAEQWALAGAASGTAYAFDSDPDGSYSYYDRIAREAVNGSGWAARVTPLRLAGVTTVLARESLPPPYVPLGALSDGGVILHQLPGPVPAVRIATRVHRAASFNETFALERSRAFDPLGETVLPGTGPVREYAAASSLRIVEETGAKLVVEVESNGGVLVWARTFWPAFRVVGGARVRPADAHLCGIELPVGRTRIVVEWNGIPLAVGAAAFLAGIAIVLSIRLGRRKSKSIGITE